MARSVALLGTPNAGKTSLFNALTGLSAKTGNYPGITVECREGSLKGSGEGVRVIDLPGTYSLVPNADDEGLAVRRVLATDRADLLVVLCDATQLDRSLYLALEAQDLGCPVLIALSMTDTLEAEGGRVRPDALADRLGVPVVNASSRRPDEVEALRLAIVAALEVRSGAQAARPSTPEALIFDRAEPAALAAWKRAMHEVGGWQRIGLAPTAGGATTTESPADIVTARHRRAQTLAAAALEAPPDHRSRRLSDRIDTFVLHRVFGPLFFVAVFGLLFQALFTWATPAMDGIADGIGVLGVLGQSLIPAELPLLRSLVADGLFAGVGNVLVFVPQIALLFLFLAALEDSGFLARAAVILDRPMSKVGLHGRAFVPMVSGLACAVPALMATRAINNERDRLVAILVTPLISCSARLPVYALVIAAVFSGFEPVFGFIEVGTLLMFAMYGTGLVAAVAGAWLLKGTLCPGTTAPLVIELPPYRWPRFGDLVRTAVDRVRVFVTEAGTIIFALTVVLWALFTFPRSETVDTWLELETARLVSLDQATADIRRASLENEAAQKRLEASAAGQLGRWIEPVVAPLGFDWKLGIGIVASFAAREVLVSTLGLVHGLGNTVDEQSVPLRDAILAERKPDGTAKFTPLVGLSLMVFYALAMQCMSTVAAVRRETHSYRWPIFQFIAMSVLAYVCALVVYQVGRIVGLGT